MNIGEFHSRVKTAIKRGSSYDDVIPFWAADAARIQEQNYTFSWMKQSRNVVFPAGNEQLKLQLDPMLKSIEWVKPVIDKQDGYEWYGEELIGVDERRVVGITGGYPSGYWLEGLDFLCFDSIPGVPVEFKVKWNIYTEWSEDLTAQPYILRRCQSLLFFQTLILFANEARDARMADTYGGLLQGALSTALRSEEELKLQHQNNLKQEYVR